MEKKDSKLGEYIQNERLKKDITQDKLAEKCGLSLRQIQNIEYGVTRPSIMSLTRIMQALDMSFDRFVFSKEENNETEALTYRIGTLSSKNIKFIDGIIDLLLEHEKD